MYDNNVQKFSETAVIDLTSISHQAPCVQIVLEIDWEEMLTSNIKSEQNCKYVTILLLRPV